jgi:1-phosphofructokinase
MILTVTMNPAVDHTVRVEGEFHPDKVTRATSAQYDPGGKGINVSKYLDAFGVETAATGFTGGFLGNYIHEQLDRAKITNDFVEMSGCTRLNTTVLADDGEYKLNQSGHRVKQQTVRELIAKIASYEPETVVVAGSLPPNLGPAVIDRVADAGPWDTVVDVQGDVIRALGIDYAMCAPNRDELASATGKPVHTVAECVTAARELRDDGFDRVLASLGSDGAVLAGPDGTFHVDAVETDVVDTVGAGDGLLAGVLATLARGQSDRHALRVGAMAAASVVSVPGTTVPDTSALREDAADLPLSVE